MKTAAILLLAVSASLYGQNDPPKVGEVTFEFVLSGGVIGVPGRLIVDSDSGTIYDARVDREVILHLPYGKYPITFDPVGFETVSRSIAVDQPEQLVVLSVSFSHWIAFFEDFGWPQPGTIRAKVQPATSCLAGGALWAKIAGAYSDYSEVRKIQPDGTVLFEDIDEGLYVFMVLDASQLRSIQTVQTTSKSVPLEIKSSRTLDIKLQGCHDVQ